MSIKKKNKTEAPFYSRKEFHRDNLFMGAGQEDFERSKRLRKDPTPAEHKLWQELRKKRLGVKFRRQHPLWKYTVDFYCAEKKLAIELDGKIHDKREQRSHDENRTAELTRMGVQVLRFRNSEVEQNIKGVLDRIRSVLEKE